MTADTITAVLLAALYLAAVNSIKTATPATACRWVSTTTRCNVNRQQPPGC